MSSRYRRICLSHEPPLILDKETTELTPPNQPEHHPHCTIGLGRFSSPLVEVWLPTPYSDVTGTHAGRWYDITWMERFPGLARLLASTWPVVDETNALIKEAAAAYMQSNTERTHRA